MTFPNEHSLRLEKPIYDKYRRTEGGTIFGSLDVPKTISIIWGHINSEKQQAWHPQALRFPTRDWSVTEAKGWIKKNIKNYISFTEATNENVKTFLKFRDFLNESLEPDEDVKRGDIVTIYGKRNEQKKIGDTSFEMGGSYIGKKEYAQEIVVSEVGKNYRGKKVIYKAYFLDGTEVPLDVTYWYSTQSGGGQKYLHKYEK